ncbi:MAG: ABC transporter ATP-binding protein/permease [Lachnospiraceae bacterium]|nr:ABC transporter ATP-binding protein/permease [Lachnospiraceae bacterium]
MVRILKKLRVLLDKKQKHTMVLLVFMMLIGAILEAASITLVIPVVGVVMDTTAVERYAEKYSIIDFFYQALGRGSTVRFAVASMLLLIILFVLKNVYLYVEQKVMYRFVYGNQFRTSERMMRNYLRKGYEFYLNADTAVIQRNITSDVNNMYALILSILQLVSESIVFVTLILVLLIQDPVMTILIAAMLILTILLIKGVLKPVMQKAGKDNQDYYSGLFKWISQTVQGIKEVKISCKEQYFVDEYVKCGRGYVNAVQKYTLYNSIPRLLIETVCIICMLGYMIVLVLSGKNVTDMMPVLTAFGVAALRLMPSANRIQNQMNSISFYEPFFMGVSDNLQDEISGKNVDMSFATVADQPLPVEKEIELKDIVYKYPNTDVLIFNKANMTIPVGAAVGIVGTSGAGKTTLVDVLLGLLETESGQILADGVDVKEHYRSWLRNIGYIPQMIFMLDDTIRKNVAFGIPEDQIDEERVWAVLKEAQLDEYIKTLPEGLDTSIGERGIRLSGGQRQRIGIARALYNDPEVLILDEATSALDNDTEAAIMDSINALHGRKTLIIIAHRLQTIEKCDMVYRVEGGKATLEKGKA